MQKPPQNTSPLPPPSASPWHVYLLRCKDDTLYCGITNNMERRLRQHNGEISGGAKYTQGRRPVTLCATAPCKDKSEAAKLEARIRILPRQEKIAALEQLTTQKEEKSC